MGLEGGHADGAGDDVIGGPEPPASNASQEPAGQSADVEEDATAHAPITESPNSAPAELQIIQNKPTETANEETLSAKRVRRTTKLLNIGGCDTCGEMISEVEKGDRSLVAECTKKGCETRWVSPSSSPFLHLSTNPTPL
jgi:hypothetical protein